MNQEVNKDKLIQKLQNENIQLKADKVDKQGEIIQLEAEN